MHPPHINSKSQLENFGRHFFFSQIYFFFLLRKTSIGEVWTFDGNQEDFTLKGHSRREFLHPQKLWLRVWATCWDNHTTAAAKNTSICPSSGIFSAHHVVWHRQDQKDITEKWPNFFLERNAVFRDTTKHFVVLGLFCGVFFGKTITLGSPLKQNKTSKS